MMNIKSKINTEKLLMYAAFIFFFLITCYKLTYAPLWYDETVEWWYSKILIGALPFPTYCSNDINMYERIISTFQPPLYNILMYFWLKVSSSEFWFRFFGVVMGFMGNVAIYKSVKKIGNGYIAALSVFFTSCVSRLLMYWQECAEYCLMLGTLCWTVYFFISFIKEPSHKNIILLTIFSIIPIYSQYGAAFPVVSMLLVAYAYMLTQKNKKLFLKMTGAYVIAFLFATLPLIFFFLLKQVKNQHGGSAVIQNPEFEVNFFCDFAKNFVTVINYNFFSKPLIATLFSCVFVLCGIIVLCFSKKTYAKALVTVNFITYVLYYFAVKTNLYAGWFGGRYCLFFIPLWIIMLFCFGIEITILISKIFKGGQQKICRINMGIAACAVVCYMFLSWHYVIKYNWVKSDIRTAVNSWIDCGAYDYETIVYAVANDGFLYYLRQNDKYSANMENNVNYMETNLEQNYEGYSEYVNSLYGEAWPEVIYFIGFHLGDDINDLEKVFTDNGYSEEKIFDENDGILIKMSLR